MRRNIVSSHPLSVFKLYNQQVYYFPERDYAVCIYNFDKPLLYFIDKARVGILCLIPKLFR